MLSEASRFAGQNVASFIISLSVPDSLLRLLYYFEYSDLFPNGSSSFKFAVFGRGLAGKYKNQYLMPSSNLSIEPKWQSPKLFEWKKSLQIQTAFPRNTCWRVDICVDDKTNYNRVPLLLTGRQVRETLKISRTSLYRLVKNKTLVPVPAYISRRRFLVSDVVELLKRK